MKRWIRNSGLGLAAVALLAGAALVVAAQLGERKSHRRIELAIAPVAIADDGASVARGRYLFMSRGCTECHGVDGAGKDVINDGKGMLIHAPNITPGAGSAVAAYRDVDWVRTIRHGVKPNGEPAMVMPSEDYNRLTDADTGALIAFLRRLPPVPAPGATVQFPVLVRALYAVGVVRDAAEKIDHALPPAQPVAEAVTAEHGAYVASACIGCHGASLSGGKIPGAPPDWPAAANLTPGAGSAMARYADARAFATMLRTGKRPDGSAVSTVMPFSALSEMSDTDLQAIWLHLKALPPKSTGEGR
jgi:mono/diheme cytochrome c family protein